MLRLNYTEKGFSMQGLDNHVRKITTLKRFFRYHRIQKLKVPFVVSINLVKRHLEVEGKSNSLW